MWNHIMTSLGSLTFEKVEHFLIRLALLIIMVRGLIKILSVG